MTKTFPEELEPCFKAGLELIKIRARDKRPTDNGWQKRCYAPGEILRHSIPLRDSSQVNFSNLQSLPRCVHCEACHLTTVA